MEENHTVFAKSLPVQATAKVTIKDFLEVMTTSEAEEKYDSDIFMVGDVPMAISVYPNGDIEDNKGYVGVFLWNESDADIPVKCHFNTDVETLALQNPVVEANRARGFSRFFSHGECIDFYKERDFVLTVNVEIPGKVLKIVGNETVTLPKKYCVCKNLYEKMERSDFSIICDGVSVPCHKHVLSAASPVFAAMVDNQHLLEGIEGKAKIVEISEEVGHAFVRFMYTGELEDRMLKEQPVVFLELGDKYDVKDLKNLAEAELLAQLDKKNMVEFLSVGDFHNANKIFEAALKMTKSNMTWLRSQVCVEKIGKFSIAQN